MEEIVRYYLERIPFGGIADYLGLSQVSEKPLPSVVERDDPSAVHLVDHQMPVSIVIPCFNEELILPYLANTLKKRRTCPS